MPGRSVTFALLAIAVLFVAVLSYSHIFGPVNGSAEKVQFVISPDDTMNDIAVRLKDDGLIRYAWAFRLAYVKTAGVQEVRPGGYELSPSMDTLSVAGTLAKSPYLAWVVIPPGLRKEQVGNILAKNLSWTDSELTEWLTVDTVPPASYDEGVYLADTYLIPSDQTPAQIAAYIRGRFSEAFQPYAQEAIKKNIKWTTVLTVASLIEREAAGPDRKLISGIIWNRLQKNMLLQIDASLQYIKGNDETGWWPIVKSEDKYLDSPFNTYEHTGLPPYPIASPSLASIDAALNPDTTKCLYYLHDPHGQIHCSVNYAGQLANVNKYLK